MKNVEDRKKCKHGPCDCMARDDEDYCSTYCESAAAVRDTEIGCSCGHPACR